MLRESPFLLGSAGVRQQPNGGDPLEMALHVCPHPRPPRGEKGDEDCTAFKVLLMPLLSEITTFLRQLAPPALAETWDNVGLLVGDEARSISAAMTCLTLTPDVAAEAIENGAKLIVTHHPVLFRPVQRLTADSVEGRMLLDLIAAGIAVYSPHTGYDTARDGINQQLAECFQLMQIEALRPLENSPAQPLAPGSGRCGNLPRPMLLSELLELTKTRLNVARLQFVGRADTRIERLGIACGSAAEFLPDAARRGCQALLTGEARFHACLEARTLSVALVLPGHYATERPAMERLASVLAAQFSDMTVWPSRVERDPVEWV